MTVLNRTLLLETITRHETLTLDDLEKEENLGLTPNREHLQFLLTELQESGYLSVLMNIVPPTYTITDKGIAEGKRLKEVEAPAA